VTIKTTTLILFQVAGFLEYTPDQIGDRAFSALFSPLINSAPILFVIIITRLEIIHVQPITPTNKLVLGVPREWAIGFRAKIGS